MKAVSYARVSTRSQEDNSSLESQLKANREYAAKNGIEIVREVKEVFSGAYLFDRPLLNQIRDEIKLGRYDALIVYDVDRLTRDTLHLGVLLHECTRYNTRIAFVQGDFENTPEGRLVLSIKGYLAEAERLKITERTTRGRKSKALAGTLSFKRRLYGYYLDDEGRRVILEPEAENVRKMFSAFLAGRSLRQIATDLNSRDVPTPRGRSWFARSVQIVLNNPSYCGRTYVFRMKEGERFVEGEKRSYQISLPAEGWIELKDVTPAIVGEDDFLAVQKLLHLNRTRKRGEAKHEFLLRGFIRCRCGRLFTPKYSKGGRRYACTSSQLKSINCRTRTLNAGKVEEAVWSAVLKLVNNKRSLRAYIEKRGQKSEIKDNSAKVKKLEKDLERLVARMADVDDKLWNIVQKQIVKKQGEIELLETDQPEPKFDQKGFAEQIASLDFNNLDFAGKVKALKLLDVEIFFDGENLDIKFALL